MRSLLSWFFRNRQTGAITIAQMPNLALWIVIASTLLEWLAHPEGRLRAGLDAVSRCALAIWAIDELARGVNPWRRCLGAGGLLYCALGLVRDLTWPG